MNPVNLLTFYVSRCVGSYLQNRWQFIGLHTATNCKSEVVKSLILSPYLVRVLWSLLIYKIVSANANALCNPCSWWTIRFRVCGMHCLKNYICFCYNLLYCMLKTSRCAIFYQVKHFLFCKGKCTCFYFYFMFFYFIFPFIFPVTSWHFQSISSRTQL